MTGDAVHDEIARLEERIEALGEARERCRKISLFAKIAIACGASWLVLGFVLASVFGVWWALEPSAFFAALAAMIGGVVLLGSNATTWTQTEEALREAEAARAELIGRMEMRVVEESRTVH